jgi:ankyrin repeat protein
MVSALMRKSEANEEAEAKKLEIRRAARGVAKHPDGVDVPMRDSSIEPKKRSSYPDEQDSESEIDMADHSAMDIDTTTEGSMVKIKSPERQAEDGTQALEDNDEPDVFDVNVLAWDTAASPLHLAIINGHIDVVRCLVQEFGADILLPIKIPHGKAILSLVLALQLPQEQAETMVRNLVDLGASVAQADANQNTALQFAIAERPEMVQVFLSVDKTGTRRAVNHLGFSFQRPILRSPLLTAIRAKDSLTALLLLENGAVPSISFAAYMKVSTTSQCGIM